MRGTFDDPAQEREHPLQPVPALPHSVGRNIRTLALLHQDEQEIHVGETGNEVGPLEAAVRIGRCPSFAPREVHDDSACASAVHQRPQCAEPCFACAQHEPLQGKRGARSPARH